MQDACQTHSKHELVQSTSRYSKQVMTLTSVTKVPEAWAVGIPRAVSSKFAHLVCFAQGSCVARASLHKTKALLT